MLLPGSIYSEEQHDTKHCHQRKLVFDLLYLFNYLPALVEAYLSPAICCHPPTMCANDISTEENIARFVLASPRSLISSLQTGTQLV